MATVQEVTTALNSTAALVDKAKELRPMLVDLLKQATEERSHYYVASVVRECIALLNLIVADPHD